MRYMSLALKCGEVLSETGCDSVWAGRTSNQGYEVLQVFFRSVLYRLQQSREHELLPILDGSFTVGDLTPCIEFGIEIAKGVGSFADITWARTATTLATGSVKVTGPTVAVFTFVLRLLQASQALLVLDFAARPCRVCLRGRSILPMSPG